MTDADGDTATATIDFQVVDANFPTPGTAAAAVDDDALAGGNPASTTGDLDANVGDLDGAASSEATFSGVLGGSVGADGAGSNGFSFAGLNGQAGTVGQENVTYSWTAGSNTLTATTVGGTRPGTALFTVQVTNAATGAYTVTLLDNLLHALGPNGENDATAALQYSITDADGSTVNGTLTVTFDDDAPTATAEASQNVAEGATVTGTLDFAGGADGATVTHIGLTALVFNPADANYSQAIDIGAGFIKVKADGSYSFTADNPGSGPASTTFTVTDADGDRATSTIVFQVVDANLPTPGTAVAGVDDDGLAGGNPASTTGDLPDDNADGDNNQATFSGSLGGSVGADGAGSNGFSFAGLNGQAGTVGQENVTYSWTAGSSTLTATTVGGTRPGTALFTVQVTDAATGAYRVTLLDNVLHALGPNDENDATAALQYSITDADGSTVNGTLTVTFDDDAPSATANLPVQLDDDALAGGNPGTPAVGDVDPDTANTTGTLAHGYSADGGGTTLLTAAGAVLPAGFTAAVSNGGQTLTISQGVTAVLQDPAHRHHFGQLHGHPAGCDRPPGGGDGGQPPVHGRLRGHRRRRRHRDRLAVDRRRRRHADGVGEPGWFSSTTMR